MPPTPPSPSSTSPALSLKQAEIFTKKSKNILLKWIRDGRLKASRTSLPRGNWIFFPEDLDAAQRWTPTAPTTRQSKERSRGI